MTSTLSKTTKMVALVRELEEQYDQTSDRVASCLSLQTGAGCRLTSPFDHPHTPDLLHTCALRAIQGLNEQVTNLEREYEKLSRLQTEGEFKGGYESAEPLP